MQIQAMRLNDRMCRGCGMWAHGLRHNNYNRVAACAGACMPVLARARRCALGGHSRHRAAQQSCYVQHGSSGLLKRQAAAAPAQPSCPAGAYTTTCNPHALAFALSRATLASRYSPPCTLLPPVRTELGFFQHTAHPYPCASLLKHCTCSIAAWRYCFVPLPVHTMTSRKRHLCGKISTCGWAAAQRCLRALGLEIYGVLLPVNKSLRLLPTPRAQSLASRRPPACPNRSWTTRVTCHLAHPAHCSTHLVKHYAKFTQHGIRTQRPMQADHQLFPCGRRPLRLAGPASDRSCISKDDPKVRLAAYPRAAPHSPRASKCGAHAALSFSPSSPWQRGGGSGAGAAATGPRVQPLRHVCDGRHVS